MSARRCAAQALLCLAMVLAVAAPDCALAGDSRYFKTQWTTYRAQFLTDEGRIVDTGNGDISHTEGQATGMLFALFALDRKSFERIWSWTKLTLRRPDGLFSWRWDPAVPDQPITDPNNATDGDLLLSWALLLAADIWSDPSFRDEANEIIAALETLVIDDFAGRKILLPGVEGFVALDGRVQNLSYCVFPALQEIAAHTKSPVWIDVYRDCLQLVQDSNFGEAQLPLDWSLLTQEGSLVPAPGRSPRFGYDAIRIPLYLIWAGHDSRPFIKPFESAWAEVPADTPPPSWINPFTGRRALYKASNGFLAVRNLVDCASLMSRGKVKSAKRIRFPPISQEDGYYGSSLTLFAALAAMTLRI